jgi:hypothetical protein
MARSQNHTALSLERSIRRQGKLEYMVCRCALLLLICAFTPNAWSQDKIVFKSREYKLVGRSIPETWTVTLPNLEKARLVDTCSPGEIRSVNIPADARPPASLGHWNYVQSVSASPDGNLLLVGSQAGSSSSHFEDYWLFNPQTREWRYAGGGNEAKWSPDGSKIVWASPRELAPIGKIHVWVSHLVLLDVATLRRQEVTSGTTYESDFFWCTPGETPMATLRQRFQKAQSVKAADLNGEWVLIRHIFTQKGLDGRDGPDHVLYDPNGVRRTHYDTSHGLPRPSRPRRQPRT